MILISAKSIEKAREMAERSAIPNQAWVFIPILDTEERFERLAPLHSIHPKELLGYFSYLEQEHICRLIG